MLIWACKHAARDRKNFIFFILHFDNRMINYFFKFYDTLQLLEANLSYFAINNQEIIFPANWPQAAEISAPRLERTSTVYPAFQSAC